ncbi:hypothetical protein DL96DRAFT_1710005 [Flagelloscypha sp. PMI_526]|nr:hypothetical protein DL96DRAFT_1710005 [Flagelloscypha sp. PMI_526]
MTTQTINQQLLGGPSAYSYTRNVMEPSTSATLQPPSSNKAFRPVGRGGQGARRSSMSLSSAASLFGGAPAPSFVSVAGPSSPVARSNTVANGLSSAKLLQPSVLPTPPMTYRVGGRGGAGSKPRAIKTGKPGYAQSIGSSESSQLSPTSPTMQKSKSLKDFRFKLKGSRKIGGMAHPPSVMGDYHRPSSPSVASMSTDQISTMSSVRFAAPPPQPATKRVAPIYDAYPSVVSPTASTYSDPASRSRSPSFQPSYYHFPHPDDEPEIQPPSQAFPPTSSNKVARTLGAGAPPPSFSFNHLSKRKPAPALSSSPPRPLPVPRNMQNTQPLYPLVNPIPAPRLLPTLPEQPHSPPPPQVRSRTNSDPTSSSLAGTPRASRRISMAPSYLIDSLGPDDMFSDRDDMSFATPSLVNEPTAANTPSVQSADAWTLDGRSTYSYQEEGFSEFGDEQHQTDLHTPSPLDISHDDTPFSPTPVLTAAGAGANTGLSALGRLVLKSSRATADEQFSLPNIPPAPMVTRTTTIETSPAPEIHTTTEVKVKTARGWIVAPSLIRAPLMKKEDAWDETRFEDVLSQLRNLR